MMDELIEIFLKEALRYQGKNSNAVQECAASADRV